MKTPDFEHEIGIDTYCTNQPGLGGKLRVRIDDFHVSELFVYPPKKTMVVSPLQRSPVEIGKRIHL
jgi:hypothetical protein